MGGNGPPYVVSNFARSGTRLVASAYFVRSHSARSWLFLGTRRWYPRLCAPRRLTERLQHPEIDELAGDLFRRKIDAERFVHKPGRELDLNDAHRVAVPKQDFDVARILLVVVETKRAGFVTRADGTQRARAHGACEVGQIKERLVRATVVRQDRGFAPDDGRLFAKLTAAGEDPAVGREKTVALEHGAGVGIAARECLRRQRALVPSAHPPGHVLDAEHQLRRVGVARTEGFHPWGRHELGYGHTHRRDRLLQIELLARERDHVAGAVLTRRGAIRDQSHAIRVPEHATVRRP